MTKFYYIDFLYYACLAALAIKGKYSFIYHEKDYHTKANHNKDEQQQQQKTISMKLFLFSLKWPLAPQANSGFKLQCPFVVQLFFLSRMSSVNSAWNYYIIETSIPVGTNFSRPW